MPYSSIGSLRGWPIRMARVYSCKLCASTLTEEPVSRLTRPKISPGGVITSAGLVLAGTFAMLATLPLVEFTEIGFAVALGVLLDTIVVRSVLVTALTLDIGRHVWWPSALANPEVGAVTGGT
ncbi:MAG: MMPL family transporter [Streptosporangiaceae bacterium]